MGYEAPDPFATAAAQGAENRASALTSSVLNNPNEFTPYGSVTYKNNGDRITQTDPQGNPYTVRRQTRTVELSPAEQRKLNKSNRLQNNMLSTANRQVETISDTLAKPIDTSSAPGRVSSVAAPTYRGAIDTPRLVDDMRATPNLQMSYAPKGGFSKDRRRVEEALMSRLTPQFERDRSALETQLVNQGFTRGSDAFNNAMDEARRAETDARFQAVLAGGDEQSRLLGEARAAGEFGNTAQQQGFNNSLTRRSYLDSIRQKNFENEAAALGIGNAAERAQFDANLQSGAFTNDARSNALQELYAERNQPLNEVGAALSGGQVNNPQFMSMFRQGIEPAPVADSVYRSAQMDAQNSANMWGGLSSLFTAPFSLFGFSDERLKENIRPVGETKGGTPLYSWNYKGDPETRIGPMAQEVAKTQPEAVGVHKSGFLGVDYSKLR